MAEAILRIIGERQGGAPGTRELVMATIYDVEQTIHGDFSCRVNIPAVLDRDRHIFGADEGNAREVSAHFVRNLFHGLRIQICQEETVSRRRE